MGDQLYKYTILHCGLPVWKTLAGGELGAFALYCREEPVGPVALGDVYQVQCECEDYPPREFRLMINEVTPRG